MNITNFINALTVRLKEYRERNKFTYFDSYYVFATEGKKYFKVYRQEMKDGKSFSSGSIVAFVDKTTGDIFKPASFNTPAKHARGNVNSENSGMEAITDSGSVIYLK